METSAQQQDCGFHSSCLRAQHKRKDGATWWEAQWAAQLAAQSVEVPASPRLLHDSRMFTCIKLQASLVAGQRDIDAAVVQR